MVCILVRISWRVEDTKRVVSAMHSHEWNECESRTTTSFFLHSWTHTLKDTNHLTSVVSGVNPLGVISVSQRDQKLLDTERHKQVDDTPKLNSFWQSFNYLCQLFTLRGFERRQIRAETIQTANDFKSAAISKSKNNKIIVIIVFYIIV